MLQKLKLKEAVTPPPDVERKQPADAEPKRPPWRRMVVAILFVSLGAAGGTVGIASIGYRLTHLVVEDGLINGRIVRQQAPVSGKISAFYAKPGALIKSGQVLVRIGIERTPQEEQVRLQTERSQDDRIRTQLDNTKLQEEVKANATQLVTAKQSLATLRTQLRSLDNQYQAVQKVDVQLASEALSQKQANLEAAIASATSARTDYERYRGLLAAGAVTKQQTEHLRFAWESAEAEVKQVKAALRSAEASLQASRNGVALSPQNSLGSTLSDQRSKLLQDIQSQELLVSTLETQVASGRQQIQKADTLYKKNPSPDRTQGLDFSAEVQEVSAALTGVVYSTEREQGERINQSEPILTLLDCNDLWVETVVSANQASSIDTKQPVSVQIAGYTETIAGEVDLVQPISSIQAIAERTKLLQVQALMPAIPPTLVGQALARVTVRIPPPPQHMQSRHFCGLGQAARLTFNKKPLVGSK